MISDSKRGIFGRWEVRINCGYNPAIHAFEV
jgi:hypothetical protein